MKKLQQDSNQPPDHPRGLLFLLQPEFADLIPQEHEFERKLEQAWKDGRLWIESEPRYYQ
jgi:hypothetical protein